MKRITQKVSDKILKLRYRAPKDWAKVIAKDMGVTVFAVYQYAKGTKGVKSQRNIEVYLRLKKMVEEHESTLKKLVS